MKVLKESQVGTDNRVSRGDQGVKGGVLSETDHLSMARHVVTTAVTLLPEDTLPVKHNTVVMTVVLVHFVEAQALVGLPMAGWEAGEAVVATAAAEVVGVTVVGHMLALKPTLRCTL